MICVNLHIAIIERQLTLERKVEMLISTEKVRKALSDDVYKNLEDGLYESQIYRLGVYDTIDAELDAYINNILSDEKLRVKIVNRISKTLLNKHKAEVNEQKKELARNRRLWKVTKGKIPCLYQCGYVHKKTESEVLHGEGLNFICKDCTDKFKGDMSAASRIFQGTNVYMIHGIN